MQRCSVYIDLIWQPYGVIAGKRIQSYFVAVFHKVGVNCRCCLVYIYEQDQFITFISLKEHSALSKAKLSAFC